MFDDSLQRNARPDRFMLLKTPILVGIITGILSMRLPSFQVQLPERRARAAPLLR